MKVLLANPPWKKDARRYGVRAGSRWPFTMPASAPDTVGYLPFPFFLAYGTALLEARSKAEVAAVDAIGEGLTEEQYLERLAALAPDIIMAETSRASFPQDLHHAVTAKDLLPEVTYVMAGPQASVAPQDILSRHPEVDYCFAGEYEWTLLDFVNTRLDGKFSPEAMPGLAWRDKQGSARVNARRPLGDLAELPWPAYKHFPMLRYRDYFCGIPAPMVNMVASRGCPFKCSFCLWPEVMYGGHKYRTREPADVADEMAFLVDTYGFKTVYFDDDTFNIGRDRIIELAGEIRRRDRDISLAVMARADTMDDDMLLALKGAGLTAIKYGLESASQAIIDRCGKGLDIEKAKRMIRFTQDMGVKVHLTFTVGLPGETEKSIEDSINLARELDTESIQISLATPFPGTPFYAQIQAEGHLLATDEELFDGSHRCVTRTEALSASQIEEGYQRFHAAWNEHRQHREEARCAR